MKIRLSTLLLLLWLACNPSAYSQIITTVAGNGYITFSGDGSAATTAQLYSPFGVAVDAIGNMYIADFYNSRIRKVTPGGVITTFAGQDTGGYAGDGGPATKAKLNWPIGVAADPTNGNIYIADQSNNTIRMVTPAGIISTFAGNGLAGYFFDGHPATAARLDYPADIAVDKNGNVYIADMYNNVIRKVNTAGIISTVAGNGTPNYRGDNGPATTAWLNYPSGVAVDTAGNIYIADNYNSRVRKVNTLGIISTIAGKGLPGYSGDGGPGTAAALNHPFSVRVDSAENVFISDDSNNVIREIVAGVINTIAGNGNEGCTGDGGPATAGTLSQPDGMGMDGAGNLYIADTHNNRIRKVNKTSGTISTVAGGLSSGRTALMNAANPTGAAVDTNGNVIFVDADNNRVCKLSSSGILTVVAGNAVHGHSGDGGPATAAELAYPQGVALDAHGNMYIAEMDSCRIRKVDASGIISTIAGIPLVGAGHGGDGGPATNAQLDEPTGVAVDKIGNVYIADHSNSRIRMINTSGIITTVAGGGASGLLGDGGPATDASVVIPHGVATDNSGNIYIADGGHNRIRKVTAAGIITTVAGGTTGGFSGDGGPATDAELGGVLGIAVDASNNLYIACNNGYRKVNSLGIINTMAGDNNNGFTGDGGPATAATLAFVTGLAVDTSGNVYLCAYNNFRLREVQSSSLPRIRGSRILCTGTTSKLSDATAGGTWTSLNMTVATVGSSNGIVTGLAAGTATIVYDLANNTVTATVTVNPLPYADTIRGMDTVCAGASISLTDTVSGGTWNNSNANVSLLAGLVTGISSGTSVISYSITNSCGTAVATTTIMIRPVSPAATIFGASSVCAVRAIMLTDASPGGAWSSSSTSASVLSGTVTGISAGTTTISYIVSTTCGTVTAVKNITVNPLASAGTIISATSVCAGSSIPVSDATGSGVWSVSNTSASISAGILTGLSGGIDTVLYAVTNICNTDTAMQQVYINSLPGAITGGLNVCAGSLLALSDTTVGGTWSSSNPAQASIGSSSGTVSGISAGNPVIDYTNTTTGCSISETITVNPLPDVFSLTGGGSYCFGDTGVHIGLTGSGTGDHYVLYNNGSLSGPPHKGTGTAIDYGLQVTFGVYTIVAVDNITSCADTMLGSDTITVNPLPQPISGITKVCQGLVTNLSDTTTGGAWTSDSIAYATIGVSSGMVTGVKAGSSHITYTLPTGCKSGVTVFVYPLPAPFSDSATVCLGSTIVLTDQNNGTWSSNNTTIAAIDANSGALTGIGAGTAAITFTTNLGCKTMQTATVDPLPATITGAANICVNTTTTLSDASAGGKWYTTNNTVASIDSARGIVMGLTAGVATFTYALSTECMAYTTFVINPKPTPPTFITGSEVCLDSTIILQGFPAGGNWVSSNTHAGITGQGNITGLAPGTDTIYYSAIVPCGIDSTSWTVNVVQCDFSNTPFLSKTCTAKMYPNPAGDEFTVLGQTGTPYDVSVNIQITDMLGQTVYRNTTVAHNGDIDQQIQLGYQLANGSYIMSLHSDVYSTVCPIVLKR